MTQELKEKYKIFNTGEVLKVLSYPRERFVIKPGWKWDERKKKKERGCVYFYT
jgi:hypothetical protein